MSNLEHIVQKYVIDHYGDLIVAEKPVYDKVSKTWEAELRSTYPRIIRDELSNETVVRFLILKELGFVKVSDDLRIIDATSQDSCEDHLLSRIDLWKKQSEQIVVKASSDVFAKIAEGIHVLNPLGLILDELTKQKGGKFTISDEEVDEQRRPRKIREYLQLLEELEIVKKTDDGYTYGNGYVGILEQTKNESPRKLKTILISAVIRRKYSTLKQVFGITQLEPYVHLANAYYWPSLDAEKLVHTTRSRLLQRYQDYYSKVSSWDFDSRLSELMEQGAIVQENGYLIGNKERFEKMLQMKHSTVSLNP